jgi:predicted amidophosphoribosyltransferase
MYQQLQERSGILRVTLRQMRGPWDEGWVLDKHSMSSVYLGEDEHGHPQFNTTRTEVGEAAFRLKYRNDSAQATPLAQAIADNIYPKFSQVGFIVPMPASTQRVRQPVTEVADELGVLVGVPVFGNVLIKARNGKSLKDLSTKDEKIEAIGSSFSVNDEISSEGQRNVLVVDDLFHTRASMETACKVLRTYPKVGRIYIAALTWRP